MFLYDRGRLCRPRQRLFLGYRLRVQGTFSLIQKFDLKSPASPAHIHRFSINLYLYELFNGETFSVFKKTELVVICSYQIHNAIQPVACTSYKGRFWCSVLYDYFSFSCVHGLFAYIYGCNCNVM